MAEFRIRVGTVDATVAEGSLRLCDKLLAIPDPALLRDTSMRLGLNDGLHHFLDRDTGVFPAGLLHRLRARLVKRGHSVTVEREPPVQIAPVEPDYLVGIDMRDYQVEATNAALEHGRGLLWMATNSGKSAVIAALCGKLVRDVRLAVLVIVPNAYLLNQTSKDIAKFLGPDVSVGLAGDGKRSLDCDVLVATYQTLLSGLPNGRRPPDDPELACCMARAGAVLVDEAHHAAAPAYKRIMRACARAAFRYGCTGSLDKSDKRADGAKREGSDDAARMHRWWVEAYLGPLLYRVDNAFLIEAGHSAVPRFFVVRDRAAFGALVRTPRPNPNSSRAMNVYNHVFNLACVQDRRWHRTVCAVVAHLIELGRPPFVFSHSVKHLLAMSAELRAAGVAHAVLHGDHAVDHRERIVKEFSDRGDFAILASSIFDEGASIPAIRSVVFAGARMAPFELLQRLGRGFRMKGDDNTVIVIDFDPVHSTMLHGHFEARLATFRDQGFKVRYVDDLTQLPDIVR